MVRLVLTEIFKVRKRWMPYVLLVVMVGTLAMVQFAMYASQRGALASNEAGRSTIRLGVTGPDGREIPIQLYCADVLERPIPDLLPDMDPDTAAAVTRNLEQFRQGCSESQAAREEAIEATLSSITLPRVMETVFGVAQSVGSFLLVILAASVVGAEYAWGTVRTNVMRGMGRGRHLFSKLIAVMALALVGLLVVLVAGFVFATITTVLVDGGLDWSSLDGLFVGRVLAMLGRTWFVLAIPVCMTVMAAVLTRSSAFAIGVGIAYPLLEGILLGVLGMVGGWGETLVHYTMSYNISAVMALNAAGEVGSGGVGIIEFGDEAFPSFWRAGGLLVAYAAAFLALAVYSFRTRDLTA